MRTAIVGLGEIGQHHLGAIRSSRSAKLVAVCDLDPDLVESSAGDAHGYTSLGAMLAGESLDTVDICLPHSLHVDAAVEVAAAGCHVIVEKPMAVDLAGCDRIIAATTAAGVRVGVSHNQLFYDPHRRVGELLREGALGEIRALYSRLWIGGRYRGWREQPEIVGGGLLMDAGVHRIYLLRALGGPVAAVTASMDEPRSEERFAVELEFASGVSAIAQGSYFGPAGSFDDRTDVVGTSGMASVSGCEAYFEGDLTDEPQLRVRLGGRWFADPVRDSWDASVARSVWDILDALADGADPFVDENAARETVALIDAAYRSAERGERIELDVPATSDGPGSLP